MTELDPDLIVGILQRREPGLLHEIFLCGLAALENQSIVEVRSVVGVELLDAGLDADGEPTPYGIELEDQISALGRLGNVDE